MLLRINKQPERSATVLLDINGSNRLNKTKTLKIK